MAAASSGNGTAVKAFGTAEQVFVFCRREQAVIDRDKRIPSDQPKVRRRNPFLNFMEQWSNTFARSSAFLEWERSNRLSSIMKTSFRLRP